MSLTSPVRKRNSIETSLHSILLGFVIKARPKDIEPLYQISSLLSQTSGCDGGTISPETPPKIHSLHNFPLRESASFRPSEIIQGLYLGGVQDIAFQHKKTVLYPKKMARVYVCCCAQKANTGEKQDGMTCTSPTDECRNESVCSFYRPSLVEVHKTFKASSDVSSSPSSAKGEEASTLVSVEKYRGDWWRNTDLEFDSMLKWIETKFLIPLRLERDQPDSSKGDKHELIIRIPAQDEIEYSFSRAEAPYMHVVPKLLNYLIQVSEAESTELATQPGKDSKSSPPDSSAIHAVPSARWFSIVFYCAAGRSRSVTILAATLLRQLLQCLVNYKNATKLQFAEMTTINPFEDFYSALAGDVESVASIAVDVVLKYIRVRRAAINPNPGFHQQLIDYACSELEKIL